MYVQSKTITKHWDSCNYRYREVEKKTSKEAQVAPKEARASRLKGHFINRSWQCHCADCQALPPYGLCKNKNQTGVFG